MNLILIKLGIRNVFRNKRRTLLTSLAIGIGLMSLIIADGFILGMKNYMIRSVTDDYLGHGQIHHTKFLKTNKVKFIIDSPEEVEKKLSADAKLKGYSPRTISSALIASAEGSEQISLVGIKPKYESILSKIKTFTTMGNYLEKNDKSHILIGKKLASKLKVGIGDKVVLTLSPIGGGDLSQELFRIKGIFSYGSSAFDNHMAFINLGRAQQMLGCKGCIHEFALKFNDLGHLSLLFEEYKNKFPADGHLFENWKELMPALNSALELTDISMAFLAAFLAILVGATVVNTLYMALYERKFEFGVLLAIGTRKRVLFIIIIVESIALAIGSIIIGSILTIIFGGMLAYYGVDYGGVTYASVPLREPIYMVFSLKQFIIYPLGLIIFTILISFYPIWQILKIPPSKSLKII